MQRENFGSIIAFLIPGFIGLWGMSYVVPEVRPWLSLSSDAASGSGAFQEVFAATLASLAVGLTISAIRWALIDTLHHRTGVPKPPRDFRGLIGKLAEFEALIENHYRYYQYYANTLIALPGAYILRQVSRGECPLLPTLGVLAVCGFLYAGSRDALSKFYRRSEQLFKGAAANAGDQA